jgi:hypothetical protein
MLKAHDLCRQASFASRRRAPAVDDIAAELFDRVSDGTVSRLDLKRAKQAFRSGQRAPTDVAGAILASIQGAR